MARIGWGGACFVFAMPLMAGFGGCARDTAYAPSVAPRYMTVRRADLFQYGPLQPGSPYEVPSHTVVRITSMEPGGYSRVLLANGFSGYIEMNNLMPAPPMARSVSKSQLFPAENYAALEKANEPHVDFSAPVDILPSDYTNKPASSGTNQSH